MVILVSVVRVDGKGAVGGMIGDGWINDCGWNTTYKNRVSRTLFMHGTVSKKPSGNPHGEVNASCMCWWWNGECTRLKKCRGNASHHISRVRDSILWFVCVSDLIWCQPSYDLKLKTHNLRQTMYAQIRVNDASNVRLMCCDVVKQCRFDAPSYFRLSACWCCWSVWSRVCWVTWTRGAWDRGTNFSFWFPGSFTSLQVSFRCQCSKLKQQKTSVCRWVDVHAQYYGEFIYISRSVLGF